MLIGESYLGMGYMGTLPSAVAATYPYYKLGAVDITQAVQKISIKGMGRTITKKSIPGQIKSYLRAQGTEPLEFSLELWYNSYATADTVKASINSAAENLHWYHGRSDWWHMVRYVEMSPIEYRHQWASYSLAVALFLEDPYQYEEAIQDEYERNYVLPLTSATFTNSGTVAAPWSSILTHSQGGHVTSLTASVITGITVDLCDELLTDEYINLIDGEEIVCKYADSFGAAAKFAQDKYASSGATVTGGNLTIANGYVTYKFFGPNPTSENIALVATITYTGTPKIQTSTDNATWTDAVLSTDIVSGVSTLYYLTGSEKRSIVYVRFYCGAADTLTIADVAFEAHRTIADGSSLAVPASGSAAITISGTGTADVDIIFRSRKWA